MFVVQLDMFLFEGIVFETHSQMAILQLADDAVFL